MTSCSAKRLVKLARADDPDFKLSGEPLGLAEDEVCASPPASAGEQSRPELAAESVDQPSLDEETRLYQPSLDQPQPESRRGLAPRLLLVKSAYVSDALKNGVAYAEQLAKYKVNRGRVLGQGPYGTVYAGSEVGRSDEPFAIKLFDRECQVKREADAMSEGRRCFVVKAFDFFVFEPETSPTIQPRFPSNRRPVISCISSGCLIPMWKISNKAPCVQQKETLNKANRILQSLHP